MPNISSVMRYAWSAPTTALGFVLVLAGLWRAHVRIVDGVIEAHGPTLAWLLSHLTLMPGGAAALTLGHVVVGRDLWSLESTRAHERVHVRQCEVWGPLFVPAYLTASLSTVLNPPIVGMLIGNFVVSEPGVAPPPEAQPFSQSDRITPGLLGAYGLALRAGRDFDDRDSRTGEQAMIVNEAFVRRFIHAESAIGRAVSLTYRMPSQGDYALGSKTIVGVVSDSIFRSIRDRGHPTIYLPFSESDGPILNSDFYIAIRASGGSPALFARQVSEAILALKRDLTLTVRPIGEQIDAAIAQDRLVAMLGAFFGALAVVLAALGLYGITAYSVARRQTEIGVRMALGAAPVDVVRLVLSRVALLLGAGIVVGVVASLWVSTLVASLLHGIEPRDPATLAWAAVILAAVGASAGWLPAWRASRTDPAAVLRNS